MPEHHTMMDGKLHLYRRENSSNWQCATFLNGRNWRSSTKEDSLSLAKDFAEDWYLGLRGKRAAGLLKTGKTFKEAAKKFIEEYEALTKGERSPKYVEGLKIRINVHLMPFFQDTLLTEITPGVVQDYRVHRRTSRRNRMTGKIQPPSESSLKQEIVGLSHVLRTAHRHGWLSYVPNLSAPFRSSTKVSHRAWFSPNEYKQLYTATRERIKNPPHHRWLPEYRRFHDYVLFMANTGLRPDECARLQYRDVKIVKDVQTGEHILELEVRGKRGVGFCKSMPGAVRPFERMRERSNGQPTDVVFGKPQRILMNTILKELGLKFDREGNRRDAYSLRHSYICFRLMEGADIYAVARNCRTSVEMIQKHYAQHIKNLLDASAINMRGMTKAQLRTASRRPRDVTRRSRPRPKH